MKCEPTGTSRGMECGLPRSAASEMQEAKFVFLWQAVEHE